MVICVSMKMRMKTRTAGSRLATIIHTGKALFLPRGLMTQPLFSGAVTENPVGTLSFCRAEVGAGEPWRESPEGVPWKRPMSAHLRVGSGDGRRAASRA